MKSNRKDIQLLVPDVERDAPYAFDWFSGPKGVETLLSMGNAKHEIVTPTLEGEQETIKKFIDLERDNLQVTRMILVDNKTIGAIWIELYENHGIKSPSIHIIIGDPEYRKKGIGSSAMKSAIDYAKNTLGYKTIYSRHLANNQSMTAVSQSLGFEEDGTRYTDGNGLTWQNVKLDTVQY